jgi:hypothetical protein
VADEPVAATIVMPVRHQQPGHQARQHLGSRQLRQQVEVVAQEAIVIEPDAEAGAVAGQEAQEEGSVLIVVEDGLAGVAAVEDVVTGGCGPKASACAAGHRTTLR